MSHATSEVLCAKGFVASGAADGTIHAFVVPGAVSPGDGGVDGGPDMDAGGGGWCNVAAGRRAGGSTGLAVGLLLGLALVVSRLRSRSARRR